MPEEVICAGGVVLRGEKFLAMKRFNGVWLLPKGHVDPGETLEETAVREVAEETGLKAQLGPKLGETAYSFRENGILQHKRVHWFLMESDQGEPRPEEGMFSEVRWLGLDEIDFLTFEHDRELVKKAFRLREEQNCRPN
ncbi:MAG TPA: NUDIX hydrolase [Firmicutes bacterium]|jgi:8-oxo-dGTP pyrophosphatase MutT (NUDIX family)|nr:NUDIX hydrolase [Bacillota bacterium]HOQ24886.1 NUDIX hydrolase [Bacillota bacterium]HPT68255.1 NUDIX hydrolase [Bacillota bacterium]